MSELSNLVNRRGQAKAKLTRIVNFIKSFENNDSIHLLKARIQPAAAAYQEFENYQSQIELLDPESINSNEREQFENQYFNVIANINETIERRELAATTLTSNSNSPSASLQNNNSTVKDIQVKLPVLNLPIFSGHYSEWLSFYDTFYSLIHENNTLNNCQKFHYLKSCLRGDALRAVESLAISNSNYIAAFEILTSRYNNKRLISQDHVCSIINTPSIAKTSASALRQLLNNIITNVEALKVLNLATWDALIVPLITEKLDYSTKREWQATLTSEIPTYSDITRFLDKRCQILESLDQMSNKMSSHNYKTTKSPHYNKHSNIVSNKSRVISCAATNKTLCYFCNSGQHLIYNCPAFLRLSPTERSQQINKFKACINCLKNNHETHACKSKFTCRECKQAHNTLLHLPVQNQTINPASIATIVSNYCANTSKLHSTLLSTAIIKIKDSSNNYHQCRALLDVGSQCNIISNSLCKELNLKNQNIRLPISGVNCATSIVTNMVNVEIKSRFSNFTATFDCLVLPKVTENLPTQSFNINTIQMPDNINLADSKFYESNQINLLIGAEIFWNLLRAKYIKSTNGQPHFHDTELGWIVGGPIKTQQCYTTNRSLSINHGAHNLEKQVSKLFWEIDETENKSLISAEENICESFFKQTFKRDSNNRFIVSLPMKDIKLPLGRSRAIALKRFYSLERKLNKQPQLKQDYVKFMNEYLQLGHMETVNEETGSHSKNQFYLPHHAVIKPSSLTTRLRVVFDASCKAESGISLNEILMTGPVLQQDLFSLITRFRTHQYVFTADISKMYRQILVDARYRDLQRILWRNDDTEPIKTFRLKTVTYGTAPATWIAVRCLHELAEQMKINFPRAHAAIINDFYMDDILSGGDTINEVLALRDEVITVLRQGCFELSKWASNDPKLLANIECPLTNNSLKFLHLDRENEIRTLGLIWDSKADILKYDLKTANITQSVTKRYILSTIAQIFDPLGLISPIITKAKILLQQTWQLKLGWDATVPQYIREKWLQLINAFNEIDQLKIPRKVTNLFPYNSIEMHAFCDASQQAYGAAIYIRTVDKVGNCSVTLLCAKSRVAPLKTISLPRLELCGALLMARLVSKVSKTLNIKISKRFFWTDSSIVLSWLSLPSNTWHIFVANRVAEIQGLANDNEWHHINSKYNPADVLSRGTFPKDLVNHNLWWNPDWLKQAESMWPKSNIKINNNLAPEKREAILAIHSVTYITLPVLTKFSSYNKLQRVIAHLQRFINRVKNKESTRFTLHFSIEELHKSTKLITRLVQQAEFNRELSELKKNQYVSKQSKLFTLNPFLDDEGIIRVGGRLKHAMISYDNKYPIILPAKHHVTRLLIIQEHERQIHAGPQATLCALRTKFWPLAGRSTVRNLLHKCIRCFRANPQVREQIMSDLPTARVTPARPFITCGVDYAGPLLMKEGHGRGKKSIKCYIALFICFATKAVHLELVSDCTTDAFLAALKRFMARRGRVLHIHSDNATNFVGAKRELLALAELFKTSEFQSEIINNLSMSGIKWNFIPSKSPHRGGLWEAGVKSVKYHLKRVLGNTLLTYEKLYTVLTQIEACVNSRPLTALSSDPNDLNPLTPGHFLIGEALATNVEPDLKPFRLNCLSRWQHVQQLQQHFWNRWNKEYLCNLQQRSKWRSASSTILTPGCPVLLKENNLPPLCWRMGRISEVYPGKDGIVRTVSVKTNSGVVRRASNKICVLPIETDKDGGK